MSQCCSPEFFASWFQRNSFYESMGANDLGYGQFGPEGQCFHRGPFNIATYLIL